MTLTERKVIAFLLLRLVAKYRGMGGGGVTHGVGTAAAGRPRRNCLWSGSGCATPPPAHAKEAKLRRPTAGRATEPGVGQPHLAPAVIHGFTHIRPAMGGFERSYSLYVILSKSMCCLRERCCSSLVYPLVRRGAHSYSCFIFRDAQREDKSHKGKLTTLAHRPMAWRAYLSIRSSLSFTPVCVGAIVSVCSPHCVCVLCNSVGGAWMGGAGGPRASWGARPRHTSVQSGGGGGIPDGRRGEGGGHTSRLKRPGCVGKR